jgi:hypothetical protein
LFLLLSVDKSPALPSRAAPCLAAPRPAPPCLASFFIRLIVEHDLRHSSKFYCVLCYYQIVVHINFSCLFLLLSVDKSPALPSLALPRPALPGRAQPRFLFV